MYKNMKNVVKLFSIFMISLAAQAGVSTSGGGGAFVCRDSSGNIQSSYLLDLWEAKQLLNFNIIVSNESVELQIQKALTKLQRADTLLAQETAELIPSMFGRARILSDDISLPPPTDADNRYEKKGCPLEGMMFYDGDLDQLQINPSVFNKLATNTDIAAAKLHEALYFIIRNHSIKNSSWFNKKLENSRPIRKLVGCLLSSNDGCLFPTFSKNQILESSESVYLCENKQLSYYLFKKNSHIESSFPLNGCGKTNETWIGLLNQIEDNVIGRSALFVATKESSLTPTCSSLAQYYYATSFNVVTKDIDKMDGHPLLTDFSDGDSGKTKYGSPKCQKIK